MNSKFKSVFRRFAAALLSLFLAIAGAFPALAAGWPEQGTIESESGIVMDADSGAVLYGQRIHMQEAPASITKLLTALIVLENADLDDTVTYSHDAVANVESGSGNKYNLAEGDSLSVEDALYLLLLASSNQSANALAEHVAGSVEAFADLMNRKCAALGCEDSHFANPSGLNDDSQFTSAYDMALIAQAAYQNETLLKINSSESHDIAPTKNNPNGATVRMEHKLIITANESDPNYYPYAVAGKTGYTQSAGQTLVTYAEKDDRHLIAVTMKSVAKTHYQDTKTMLDYAFDQFRNYSIEDNDRLFAKKTATVGGTKYDTASLSVAGHTAVTLPADASFGDAQRELVADTAEFPADAPDGTIAVLRYSYDNRRVGEAMIVAASPVTPGTNAASGADAGKRPLVLPDGNSFFQTIADHVGILAVLILIAALAVFAIIRIRAVRRRDAERREQRLNRRDERLKAMGMSKDDFSQLVEKHKNRGEEENQSKDGKV